MRDRPCRRAVVLTLALAVLLTLPLASPLAAGPTAPVQAQAAHPPSGVVGTGATAGGSSDVERSATPPADTRSTLAPVGPDPRRGANLSAQGAESSATPSIAPVDRRRVTLVTGETVTLGRVDGELAVESVEGGTVGVMEANGRTYLLPSDVDLGTYDRSLFALETLLARGSVGGGVPVLLEVNASVGPATVAGAGPNASTERAGVTRAEAAGLRDVRYLRSAGVIAAETDPAAPGAVADLVADGGVARVSIDRSVATRPAGARAAAVATTPRSVTGQGVTVAVLDTGVDATHPDLDDRVVGRFDLVDGDGGDGKAGPTDEPLDPHGHGTHVAGVVAGSGNESDGGAHAGVAPGADLLDVRVMNEHGVGRSSAIIGGIERAVEADADVLLLSIGTGVDDSEEIAESVEWATEQGVVVVAAAGNRGRPRSIGAPGRPSGAITVGGVGDDGAVAGYSSRGPTLEGRLKPDLVAPSSGIVGPRAEGAGRFPVDGAGRYTRIGGTSVAAPQVAGAAALLLSAEPGLSARGVENRLASAARPLAGTSVYAQGSGVLDVDGALEPDVVASDAVVDFGLVETDATRNRTVVLANNDERRHVLDFEVAVRNVDVGTGADGAARLNRSTVSLAPGERVAIELTVDGNTTSGAHAGEIRYAVDGEPRSVAFGFQRGGRVTVEKRPLTRGGRVDGDELWVRTEEGTHDELLEFEDGTASFVAGGGTYVLWSTGYDEASGTTVFLSEQRIVEGPTRVVLDEKRDTVPVGVDVADVAARYGRLANRSVVVSMSSEYAGGIARRSVSRMNAGRSVRVSPDPDLDVATTFLLTTGRPDATDVDAADVFQLGHGVRGVRGPSVVEVTPGDLVTSEHRYHRSTVDERYRVRDRTTLVGVWNQRSSRWFPLEGRRTQRIHRVPDAATYERLLQGEDWTAHRETRVGEPGRRDVLAHPLVGRLEVEYARDGRLAATGVPFADGAGSRFDPSGEHTLTATVDGEGVGTAHEREGRASLANVSVEPGQSFTVRLEGNNSAGRLSRRTYSSVTLPAYAPPGTRRIAVTDRPPTVTAVDIPRATVDNEVGPGPERIAFEVDLVGVPVDRAVWYSSASPSAPPWENASGWTRAETEWSGGRLSATIRVDGEGERLSVAAEVSDIWGRRARTMTTDAVHVGEAPNASTSTIVGRLLTADGSPADNDTVVFRQVDGGNVRYVPTDTDGRFAVEVPITRHYDLVYARGRPWSPPSPKSGDRPAWFELGRVDPEAEEVDLGETTLPRAGALSVNVTDERGEPVSGASVRVRQRTGNLSLGDRLRTDDRGRATLPGADVPGIALAGRVNLTVGPPRSELYPEQTHAYTVTLDGPRSVNVTLETAPPTARLSAFGKGEPGDVAFLHARRSDVPAGAVEYRWDVDGDGEVDRATEEPIVRYTPPAGTWRPSVTVVDASGKTSTATLTLRIGDG